MNPDLGPPEQHACALNRCGRPAAVLHKLADGLTFIPICRACLDDMHLKLALKGNVVTEHNPRMTVSFTRSSPASASPAGGRRAGSA